MVNCVKLTYLLDPGVDSAMPLWYGGEDIADQSGRNVVITGGTSGLGLSAAKALTSRGAQVIITGRSPGKGDRCVVAPYVVMYI